MEPVRVLHVVGKMHRGGIETLLMRIYRRIDRTKLQFDFLVSTREPADYDDEIRELGGHLYYVQSRRENLFANYKGIYKILKKNPDIIAVHHHMSSCTYIEPLIIAQIAKTPLRIAHSHNTQFGGGKLHQLIHNIILNFISDF